MKIGKFNCGCISLISGFDAVLILPCDDHEGQVGTTVMRDNDPVDATPDECRVAMAELHSVLKRDHERRSIEAVVAADRAHRDNRPVTRLKRGHYDPDKIERVKFDMARTIATVLDANYFAGRAHDPWRGVDWPLWVQRTRDAMLSEVNRIRSIEGFPDVDEAEIECCMDTCRQDMRDARDRQDPDGEPVETTVWGLECAWYCAMLAFDCWNPAYDGRYPR